LQRVVTVTARREGQWRVRGDQEREGAEVEGGEERRDGQNGC